MGYFGFKVYRRFKDACGFWDSRSRALGFGRRFGCRVEGSGGCRADAAQIDPDEFGQETQRGRPSPQNRSDKPSWQGVFSVDCVWIGAGQTRSRGKHDEDPQSSNSFAMKYLL